MVQDLESVSCVYDIFVKFKDGRKQLTSLFLTFAGWGNHDEVEWGETREH
jgi:hypothetical protein